LGSKSVTSEGWLGSYKSNKIKIIFDTGSDITLISESVLKRLDKRPKIHTGVKVKLVQVTGQTTITGYTVVPIYIETPDGPVKFEVEAYVVKGMSAPFILGNDFSDQYNFSVIREDGKTEIQLGNSGRRIPVDSSTSTSASKGLKTVEGETFFVQKETTESEKLYLKQRHKKRNHARRQQAKKAVDEFIRAKDSLSISPESCAKVMIKTEVFEKRPTILATKLFNYRKNEEECFAAPDSLITKDTPYLYITNFSKDPIVIQKGEAIAYNKDPRKYLDKKDKLKGRKLQEHEAKVNLIRSLAKDLAKDKKDEVPHNEGDEPIEGGPKTSEPQPDPVSKEEFLKVVDISKDLSPEQRVQLEKVLLANIDAFGLDNMPGRYPADVEIKIKEGVTPISLPPYPVSPEKRKIVDEAIDGWIASEVIEPSVSPWGAPMFITYSGGKARAVIDFRGLNNVTIPDEFPLPRQEEIFQTLSGCQYLSTFDAIYGFHQAELNEKSKDKTAFRSHRGLWQFRRVPLGFRNRPAIFQRIMQEVLAPFMDICSCIYR
jgi:hypothetical protein